MFIHPKQVGLTYFQHMRFSFYLSYKFTTASVCALVHGIYPDILITHSSDTVQELNNEIQEMRKKD